MCLTYVKKEIFPPIKKMIGYQIVEPCGDGLSSEAYGCLTQDYIYKRKGQVRSIARRNKNYQITASLGCKYYTCGFHVIQSLKQAKFWLNYCSSYSYQAVLVKCEIYDVHTLGVQMNSHVYIAPKMKIIEEVAVSPELKKYRERCGVPILNP